MKETVPEKISTPELPPEVLAVLINSCTTELTMTRRSGSPTCWPIMPIYSERQRGAFDEEGRPLSLRCLAEVNGDDSLTLSAAEGILLQPGPACLLFHFHDDRLWNLKSFVLRGQLDNVTQEWIFRLERFIAGMGIGGLRSFWRLLVNGRRRTARYLKKRDLDRPRIPWDEFRQMFKDD
jgi:hypothetical protein